jgi:hypothetical protein
MFFCKDGTQKNFVLQKNFFYQTNNKQVTPQYYSRNQHNIPPAGAQFLYSILTSVHSISAASEAETYTSATISVTFSPDTLHVRPCIFY